MSAARDRLDDLAARHGLPGEAATRFELILEELEHSEIAVTTVRQPARAVDVHVADSLTALGLEEVRRARAIADLGSGGGFPGLALAVALPEAQVTLVESVGKKCAFLERVVSKAGLANVTVVHARAEEWDAGLGAHDLVTARALGPLAVLAEYAAPLLGVGGALVAWKGRPEPLEEEDGAAAAGILGLAARDPVDVRPFDTAQNHRLYVYVKVGPTPPGYPRRAGTARKRPLRASTRA